MEVAGKGAIHLTSAWLKVSLKALKGINEEQLEFINGLLKKYAKLYVFTVLHYY